MLTQKDRKFLEKYKSQLKAPAWKFILLHGLVWGICCLLMMMLIDLFIRHRALEQQWKEGLMIDILIMLVMSLVFGWIYRKVIQKEYERLEKKHNA